MPTPSDTRQPPPAAGTGVLLRFAWLSLVAAVVTIALKLVAWRLTGSAGLLSDALESVVNLVAAALAIVVLIWAAKPPDDEHTYGHAKAEYISAGAEGAMVLIAAASIAWVAIGRLLNPAALEDVGIGVAVSVGASLINLVVGVALRRAGRRHRSLTLDANGRHVLTDVWTSAGVLVAVVAVALTGWEVLDPLIALVVAANIVFTGLGLLGRATGGLLDRALDPQEVQTIEGILKKFANDEVHFHALRTRQAGRRSFGSVHVLVPGAWTVKRGHDLLEEFEAALRTAVPGLTVFTHLEPAEDPVAEQDRELDRSGPTEPSAQTF